MSHPRLRSVTLLLPLMAVLGAAFEPLSWEEAYRRAEETLARMDVPLLFVTGLCERQSFANNLLYQNLGTTKGGAPYFSVGGYYLYFDPHCDGNASTPARWVLSESDPDVDADHDLDGDGLCSLDMHVKSTNFTMPPMGTQEWQMHCAEGEAVSSTNVTLHMVPQGEKLSLLKGHSFYKSKIWYTQRDYWYVGNTDAIPRLDLPSFNMQDAAAGFRPTSPGMSGKATVWPSMLCMAATWDPEAVRSYSEALGREFRGKGANSILGPSINVHRVARNGRNFEYLSGEDPYLGAKLVKGYVQGMQSEGVFAVVKHWVFNEQETNRSSESSIVDDKTAWELYYPPYQAAVDAGVAAVMCSYNKVDSEYSCGNSKQFKVLKESMGFKGFVQSDWWATHNTSIAAGLDQEMPGIGSGENHGAFFDANELEAEEQETIDQAATRVLAVIHKMNLSASTAACAPPHCKDFFLKDVSSLAHVRLARTLAAQSVVMLKNKDVLPLSSASTKSIAIIGPAANAKPYDPRGSGQGYDGWMPGDYYSGGGSGHMTGNVISAFAGLRSRAQELGIDVVFSLTDNKTAAAEAAARADVAFVVLGATSGEGKDRPHLRLDGNPDALVREVSAVAKATVVLVQAPGAVLMPWRDSVEGVLVMFLGGQQTGDAWADIVFGDQVPTGRLPVMMPEAEEDSIPPGTEPDVVYSEGLATSYRNPDFRAAYAFGHGLTYTTLEYQNASSSLCGNTGECEVRIRVSVKNTGGRAAPTVAQLYLQFPASAGNSVPVLKGFKKTSEISPGSSQEVVFELTQRDLSYYSAEWGGWIKATCDFTAHIGESSADIRETVTFCLEHGSVHGWMWILHHGWAIGAIVVVLALLSGAFCWYRAFSAKRKDKGNDARNCV